jgi:hypothetical protein
VTAMITCESMHSCVVGAAEADLIAEQLALANASVVLSKSQCVRDMLDRMRCTITRVATLRAVCDTLLFYSAFSAVTCCVCCVCVCDFIRLAYQ